MEWIWAATYEAHRKLNALNYSSIPVVLGPAQDEELKSFCQKEGIRAHFPLCAEDDLLCRYKFSMQELDCTHVIRLTADCWLHEPLLITEVATLLVKNKMDYVSNTIRRTFIEGLDVQGCSQTALLWFDREQKERRQHPFVDFDENAIIRRQFEAAGMKYTELLNPQMSFLIKGTSVDSKEDLERANKYHEQIEISRSNLGREKQGSAGSGVSGNELQALDSVR